MRKRFVATVAALVSAAGMAHAQTSLAKPPAIGAFGKGVQIYRCSPSAGAYLWTLKAPEATLSDAKGKPVGKHFAGPTWQSVDGSSIIGEPLNVSPSPDPSSIPWIVLRAKSHTGDGAMASVDYVVRTRTEGGVAPASGCDANHADAEVRVPYSAIYLFFRH